MAEPKQRHKTSRYRKNRFTGSVFARTSVFRSGLEICVITCLEGGSRSCFSPTGVTTIPADFVRLTRITALDLAIGHKAAPHTPRDHHAKKPNQLHALPTAQMIIQATIAYAPDK